VLAVPTSRVARIVAAYHDISWPTQLFCALKTWQAANDAAARGGINNGVAAIS